MYGKSVANERIEAWWSQLRQGCADWWIKHFKDLRESGLYCDANVVHVECLRFCYMPVIRSELQRAARLWNVHRIRPSRNPESPAGRPDILYFLPEWTETRDYKTAVEMEDIELAKDICCTNQSLTACSIEFTRLAELIIAEQGLRTPHSPNSAKKLYLELIREIEEIAVIL